MQPPKADGANPSHHLIPKPPSFESGAGANANPTAATAATAVAQQALAHDQTNKKSSATIVAPPNKVEGGAEASAKTTSAQDGGAAAAAKGVSCIPAFSRLLLQNHGKTSHNKKPSTGTACAAVHPHKPAANPIPKVTRVEDLSQYNHDELLAFYRGELANVRGESLIDMQNFPFKEKEVNHLYIQWMWPLKEISRTQPGALGPILTDPLIQKLRQDAKVVAQVKISFDRMLAFYGLEYKDGKVIKASTFEERAKEWCAGGYDHNHARISRMIESLQYFGLTTEALAFFDCLMVLYVEKPARFLESTIKNWSEKAEKPAN